MLALIDIGAIYVAPYDKACRPAAFRGAVYVPALMRDAVGLPVSVGRVHYD
jgi:hypothetical protein